MDRRLKELERLAAQGDLDAQERLANEWGRLQYVPTLKDCKAMRRCGFINGLGVPAMREGLRLWCRLLRNLADMAYNHERSTLIHSIIEVDASDFFRIKQIRDEVEGDINQIETENNLNNISHLQNRVYPYINRVLQFEFGEELAPLYQHLSAFEDALHLAYMHNVVDAFHQKIQLIIREIRGQIMTIVEWNAGEGVLLDIPHIFRYQHKVWNHWGVAGCNDRDRLPTGGWDYNPLDDNIENRRLFV